MGKVYARPSQKGPIPPWFGQTEMLEDNDVIDDVLPLSQLTSVRATYHNSPVCPVKKSQYGNYLFGQLRGGHRSTSIVSNRSGRSRKFQRSGNAGHPEGGALRQIGGEFPGSAYAKRYLYSQDFEEATSSQSEGERVLSQRVLEEIAKPPSPRGSDEDSELEVDEPREWVDPTPISSATEGGRAETKGRPTRAKPGGKNRSPEIPISHVIPCGRANAGGQAPQNLGIFTRDPPAPQTDDTDENIMPTVEGDETHLPSAGPRDAAREAKRADTHATVHQEQGGTRKGDNSPHAEENANAAQREQKQERWIPGPLRDEVPTEESEEDSDEYSEEYSEEDSASPELESAKKSGRDSKLKFPRSELLVIRPARPKAVILKANSTPANLADIVQQLWPRIPSGRRDFEIGYDDGKNEKRWLPFARARGRPVWPESFINALEGCSEIIIHLPFDTIIIRGSLRGMVGLDSEDEREENEENEEELKEESKEESPLPKLIYHKITVVELKRLAERGLPTVGRKPDLFKRLQDNDDAREKVKKQRRQYQIAERERDKWVRKAMREGKNASMKFQTVKWQVPRKAVAEAWDASEMEMNLIAFKEALVRLSGGYRQIDLDLPPLKIQVDRYMDEWLRWDMYMTPSDFHHDIFLKIDDPVINVYNVLANPDEPYDFTPSVASEEVYDGADDVVPAAPQRQSRPSNHTDQPKTKAKAKKGRPKKHPRTSIGDGDYSGRSESDSPDELAGAPTPPSNGSEPSVIGAFASRVRKRHKTAEWSI